VLLLLTAAGAAYPSPQSSQWRADHHMHLASPELCRLVGECLPSHDPPAVFAADAVQALDEARVAKGVILSCAYLYGLPSLKIPQTSIAAWTRRENEFTANEVARYPDRLIGFLSVDPLSPSSIDEIRHWRGSRLLIGLKLHFTASAVNIRSAAHRRRLAEVIAAADDEGMPLVIHVGGGNFGAADAALFIRDVLPAARQSWLQIAHAGGGLPAQGDNNLGVLTVFADHIVRGDPNTAHVLFDVAYVPLPEDTAADAARVTEQMRRIGLKRFLFGSDFNVLMPKDEINNLHKLALTDEEWALLRSNCAPWAC
jgi:uncharacterized protein